MKPKEKTGQKQEDEKKKHTGLTGKVRHRVKYIKKNRNEMTERNRSSKEVHDWERKRTYKSVWGQEKERDRRGGCCAAGSRLDVSHFNLSVGVQVMKLMDDTRGTANCNNYSTEKHRHTLYRQIYPDHMRHQYQWLQFWCCRPMTHQMSRICSHTATSIRSRFKSFSVMFSKQFKLKPNTKYS